MQSLLIVLMVIIIQIIQCLSNLALMPFHITKDGGYCIETKRKIKYNKRNYNFLIIQFSRNDGIQFWLNNSPNWNNCIKYPIPRNKIKFHVKQQKIITYYQTFFNKQYDVKNCWLLHSKSSDNSKARNIRLPIKSALQRMQVMTHYNKYINFASSDIPQNTMEDTLTLAAISMLSYYKALKENAHFYGGKIVKISVLKHVDMATHLSPPHKKTVNVGPLKLFAWKYGDIFVVSIRGTADGPNWIINFKLRSQQIGFHGYGVGNVHGNVHSGIYGVLERYLDEFLSVFEGYNNEKRIILTGHSLGSGFAQILLLHILNIRNKKTLPSKVKQIVYGSSKCSLELITFAGPSIMDKKITTELKKALDKFNEGAKNKPDPVYSAIIYFKKNDPISYSGEKGYNYIKQILGWGWDQTATQLFFKWKSKGALNKALGLDGLSSLRQYEHFGTPIIVGSSPYNTKKEGLMHLFSHAEYLEAHFYDLEDHGLIGWILKSPLLRKHKQNKKDFTLKDFKRFMVGLFN